MKVTTTLTSTNDEHSTSVDKNCLDLRSTLFSHLRQVVGLRHTTEQFHGLRKLRTNYSRIFVHIFIILLFNVFRTTGSKIEFPVSGVGGKVTAGMYLFQDTDYANPYNGIPVLTTSDMLYAQIALESPVYAVSLIARECWATPESTGTSSERFNIIEEPGCLNTQANNAKLTSNGVTWYSRFQFQVFMFMPSNVAYIHCDIELCYLTGGRTCQPTCSASGRRKRSLNSKQIRSSAIIRAKEHIEPPPVVHPVATTTVQPSQVWDTLDPLFIIIASVVAVLLLAVVALAVFFCSNRKKSGKVDKAQPLPKSHFPI